MAFPLAGTCHVTSKNCFVIGQNSVAGWKMQREKALICVSVCVYMIAGVFLFKWLYHFCYERSRRKQLSEKREGVEGE